MFKTKLDQHKCDKHNRSKDTDVVPEDQELFTSMEKSKAQPHRKNVIVWFCPDCLNEQGIEKEETAVMVTGYYRRKV